MTDSTNTTQTTAPAGAQHVTGEEFPDVIKNAGMPVFVDFFAEWCGPCKMAAPIIDKLSVEYAGRVKMIKVDTDQARTLAQQYGIMSIPTVVVLKQNGDKVEELDRKIGFGGEAGYRQILNKVAPAA